MTDHDIMLNVRNGDVGQLGLLFEKYHRHLYNYFMLQVKNRQASEDLVQDVFYRILKYRHTYKTKGNFKTWMFTVARNARIDHFREQTVQPDTLEESNDIVSSDPWPDELCERENDIALLKKALAGLPEDKREVSIMSRFNDMRYEEIGRVLGCSVAAIKVRVYRAIKELSENYFKLSGEKNNGM